MTTHLGLMMVFAFFVSVVFATLMRDEPREQLLLRPSSLVASSPAES